jgi:site-specific DNA-methyltransferase (adenine-specific)
LYIISGWSNLRDILNVANDLDFHLVNHIIWKYRFGVYTKKKYVTSHYHILYYAINKKRTFNTTARFENTKDVYHDLEDVWDITREYSVNKIKNGNKLPDALITKLIQYSSNVGDTVIDFFQGNFTTAYNAINLHRKAYGLELNKQAYDFHMEKLCSH